MNCYCVYAPSEELVKPSIENTEEQEEIDEDELTEDVFISHKQIWKEIYDTFESDRKEIQEYKASKISHCAVPLNPAVQFLEDHIFPLLTDALEKTIITAKELECIKHHKNSFNSLDYIAERLWNLNPLHPERKKNWTYIFDMNWAVEWLQSRPRPYYPFAWIWSREYAATKIQAAMRGHWVRSRDNVQEMRNFWKSIKCEREQQEH